MSIPHLSDAGMLEKLSDEEANNDDASDEDGNEFRVLGSGLCTSWNQPKGAFSCYKKNWNKLKKITLLLNLNPTIFLYPKCQQPFGT